MGNQNSKLSTGEKFSPEYRELASSPGLYQNIFDGSKIQRQCVQIGGGNELEYERDIFIFRKLHSDKLVTAYYFSDMNKQLVCSNSYRICYFTEYPSHKLAAFDTIAFDTGLKMLIQSLKGFQILYKKFGYFKITPDMVCFDHHKKIKVWLSCNMAETKIRTVEKKPQIQMIKEIFKIFDRKKHQNEVQYTNFLKNLTFQSQNPIIFQHVILYLIKQISDSSQIKKSIPCDVQQPQRTAKFAQKKDKENNPKIKSLKNRKKSVETESHKKQSTFVQTEIINNRNSYNPKEKEKRYNSQDIDGNVSIFSVNTTHWNKPIFTIAPPQLVHLYCDPDQRTKQKINYRNNEATLRMEKKMVVCEQRNKDKENDEKERRDKKKERYSIKEKKVKNEKEKEKVELKEKVLEERMKNNQILKNLKTVKSIISDQFNMNCVEFQGSNDFIESDIHSIKRVPFQKSYLEKHFKINK